MNSKTCHMIIHHNTNPEMQEFQQNSKEFQRNSKGIPSYAKWYYINNTNLEMQESHWKIQGIPKEFKDMPNSNITTRIVQCMNSRTIPRNSNTNTSVCSLLQASHIGPHACIQAPGCCSDKLCFSMIYTKYCAHQWFHSFSVQPRYRTPGLLWEIVKCYETAAWLVPGIYENSLKHEQNHVTTT